MAMKRLPCCAPPGCDLFPPQEEGTALFKEKRFFEATERYVAAADNASAVPEKTDPGGEEEAAAVALEVGYRCSSLLIY